MKRTMRIAISITLLVAIISIASADMLSDPVFDSASTNLNSTKIAVFNAATISPAENIKITKVRLYQKVGTVWYYAGSLPVPTTEATNAYTFSANYDYSSYIGTGTYRLYTTFCADGYSISRYSNTRTY